MNIRRKIYRELQGGCVMTSTQLARAIGSKPAVVSSEVRRMFVSGDLVSVAKGPRGGHAYRLLFTL